MLTLFVVMQPPLSTLPPSPLRGQSASNESLSGQSANAGEYDEDTITITLKHSQTRRISKSSQVDVSRTWPDGSSIRDKPFTGYNSRASSSKRSSRPARESQAATAFSPPKLRPRPGFSQDSLTSRLSKALRLPVQQNSTPDRTLSPHVRVVIERKASQPSRRLAGKFYGRPPSEPAVKSEKEALLKKIQDNTNPYICPVSVTESLFGLTGFSEPYLTNVDEADEKSLLPNHSKKVVRNNIELSRGPLRPQKSGLSSKRPDLVRPRERIADIRAAKFSEPFDPPLTFSNTTDEKQLSGKFQFCSGYVFRDNVFTADPKNNTGCRCDGICDPTTCSCIEKTVHDTDEAFQRIRRVEQIPVYTQHPSIPGLKILSNQFIDHDSKVAEITECNELCSCGSSCVNRVVQNGRTVALEIFKTAHCGFGVRSPQPIVRGQFIDVYLGEVITEEALTLREEASEETASSYLYSLDWYEGLQHCYHVDGENFGSSLRFVNHSCKPNARVFPVQLHHRDRRVYLLAFFAIANISAMTEITVDYAPQEAGKVYDEPPGRSRPGSFSVVVAGARPGSGSGLGSLSVTRAGAEAASRDDADADTVLCRCGQDNCRRRLWRPGTRRRRKKTVKT